MSENGDVINPESVVLQQLDGQWEKLIAFVVYKLCGRESVTITVEDMQKIAEDFAPSTPTLLTFGHHDSIELKIVDYESALRLAEHDKTMRGNA